MLCATDFHMWKYSVDYTDNPIYELSEGQD